MTVVELSRPSPTLPEILTGIGSTLLGVETTVKTLLQDLASSEEIQARMDGIILEKLEDSSYSDPFFTILKDYLGSL